jgi:hypothetical protein
MRSRAAQARALADCGRDQAAIAEWEYVLQATLGRTAGSSQAQRYYAMACRELAALLWHNGDRDQARRLHQRAILMEFNRHGSLSGRTLLNAVLFGGMEISPDRQIRLLRGIAREGSRRERAVARLRLARSAAERNDVPEALRMLRRAVRQSTGPRARGEALAWYGCLLVRSGRLAKGERMLRRGARCLLQMDDHVGSQRLLKLARLAAASRTQQHWLLGRN